MCELLEAAKVNELHTSYLLAMQQLTPTHKLAVCLAAGVAVRLACFAIWPESLQRRPELTSPLTSFRSCTFSGGALKQS